MAESDRPESAAKAGKEVAVLDHALWSKLDSSDDLGEYSAAWLALLCQRVGGASRAVLLLKSELHGQLEPISYWPKGRVATKGLSAAAETALREDRGVARAPRSERDTDRHTADAVDIAQPIRLGGEIIGIVAIEISDRSRDALALVMRDLQWGAAWITSAFREREGERDRLGNDRLRLAIELFAATLAAPRFTDSCRVFATELATELDCDRVVVTRHKRRRSRATAVSHSATFDRRSNLMRAIERVSDEAIDQWHTILTPSLGDDGTVRRAQQELMALNGGLAVLATPLPAGDRAIGGIVLERAVEAPFTEDDALFLETVAALAGPVLEDKRCNDRPLLVKAAHATWVFLARLFGPRYLGRKLALALAIVALTLLVFVERPYRVTADARLSGVVERSVTVPFDGYLDSATVRAGDLVNAGDQLARLDTRDLEIERLQRLTERNQSVVEYDQALAQSDRAGLNVLRARIGQADAKIALLDAQIDRTAMFAPFDGVVVAGDLSQRIGDAVARGEVLFEIAPLDEYRVQVLVDERDVEQIAPGQTGQLALAAFPESPVEIEITRLSPVSVQAEGRNFFEVDAVITDSSERRKMRPGMEGVAKVVIEDRRLIWIWTHRLVDWARLTFWRWRI
ncbi:HlyD family efflux transporter periplasmic adaptor subunit [Sedimentitalea sp. JM2-8]|uniref:HlyD family efflux transporter periplasmic adaptor subunit n=1 Tax=Sedimentitalea xiamensis TaxID=3050037 RepID=A0ABT7FKJ9_9RHOB|nr:HlyD family efflux transporter periplasmic adaptor subunit [Sedimentitalea xiamensis]MDK3075583.1 HlyD family efflux transporter periplasmic adaptor subunit [Sedimentitalea xiamensis]